MPQTLPAKLKHSSPPPIPPLRNGDHLDVAEFERRYAAMPPGVKAELLEGVVYMASPVSLHGHAEPHADLSGVLGIYRFNTPGVKLADNVTLRGLIGRNQPQPDLCLRILPEFGGTSRTDDEGYLEGGPELLAEISYSSISQDLHEKLEVYRKNGIPEYIVWRVEDKEIDWFQLARGKYRPLALTPEGVFRSRVFPGLWLAPTALISQDFQRVQEVLRQGLASPEHEAFVQELQKRKEKK